MVSIKIKEILDVEMRCILFVNPQRSPKLRQAEFPKVWLQFKYYINSCDVFKKGECNAKIVVIFVIVCCLGAFFLIGDVLNSPTGGTKSRSLPRVTCQQEDADSGLINDSSTREQALPREQ